MTTTIFMNGRSQAVRLPKGFRLPGRLATIRHFGDGILIEPLKETGWPTGYFDEIKIGDNAFERPSQGDLPSIPLLGE
jgi:antitoxin VapB